MSDTITSAEPIGKYIFMAALGFLAWTLSDAAIRYLNDYPVELVAFISMGFSVLFALIFSAKLGGIKSAITLPKLKLRLIRAIILSISGGFSFLTFSHLELTTAYSILFAAPILAKVFSVFLVKEGVSLKSWCISFLGFIGVLIVLRPGFIPLNIGTIAALSQMFLFALGNVLARYIGQENQTVFSMVIFQYSIITILAAVPAYMSYNGIAMADFIIMAFIGGVGVTGGALVSYAFAGAPSAHIAPLHYTQMIWGALWGALLFSEYPDIYVITGGGIIILSGLLLLKYSRKKKVAIPKRTA